MLNRLLVAILLVASASSPALAQGRPRARLRLRLVDHSTVVSNEGAKFDAATDAAVAIPAPLTLSASFIDSHSARVEHDLMLFKPTLVGISDPERTRNALLATAPEKKQPRFFAPPLDVADPLEVRRDRDKLLLLRGPQPQVAAVGLGAGMFATATLLSAHAPYPLRVLFDGPVHLGPAIFDGGGMGAGISARGL